MIQTEITTQESFKFRKEQLETALPGITTRTRKNNRKSTKGRHTQYIQCLDQSVFPPRLYTKVIKHKAK